MITDNISSSHIPDLISVELSFFLHVLLHVITSFLSKSLAYKEIISSLFKQLFACKLKRNRKLA